MLRRFTRSGIETDTAHSSVGISIPVKILSALVLWMYPTAFLHAESPDDTVSLRVQPRICVMAAGEQTCAMQMLVSWVATSSMNVCLKFPEQVENLHCWQSQQTGEYTVAVSRVDNVSVQLLNAQTGEILSEVEIPVIKRDLRDTRRRRRHAWSIF